MTAAGAGFGKVFWRQYHLGVLADDLFRNLSGCGLVFLMFFLWSALPGALVSVWGLQPFVGVAYVTSLLAWSTLYSVAILSFYVVIERIRYVVGNLEGRFMRPIDRSRAIAVLSFMNSGSIFAGTFVVTLIVGILLGPSSWSPPLRGFLYAPNAILVSFVVQVLAFLGLLLLIVGGAGQSFPRLKGSLIDLEGDVSKLTNLSGTVATLTAALAVGFVFAIGLSPSDWGSLMKVVPPAVLGASMLIVVSVYVFATRYLVTKLFDWEMREVRLSLTNPAGTLETAQITALKERDEFVDKIRLRLLAGPSVVLRIAFPAAVSVGAIVAQATGITHFGLP